MVANEQMIRAFCTQLYVALSSSDFVLTIAGETANVFYKENLRILFTKPRANMKKVITKFQYHLYNTRMLIELNFRNLKMLYAFLTSFPRSIDGYFANYIYSLLAYVLR